MKQLLRRTPRFEILAIWVKQPLKGGCARWKEVAYLRRVILLLTMAAVVLTALVVGTPALAQMPPEAKAGGAQAKGGPCPEATAGSVTAKGSCKTPPPPPPPPKMMAPPPPPPPPPKMM